MVVVVDIFFGLCACQIQIWITKQTLENIYPNYLKEDSALFFVLSESESEIRRASNLKTKSHLTISSLSCKALLEVREIVFSPLKKKNCSLG